MAIRKDHILDIDLNNGSVYRSFLNHSIGGGDNSGDVFGVRVFKNRNPQSLSGGACVGFFIRADDTTLVINGTVSENVAYVVLPEAAYVKEGQFTLTIKISGTGFADSMRIVDGTVIRTSTNALVDPGSVVPSLADLMAVIERAEDAADEINGITIAATQITGTRYKLSVTKEE